MAIDMPPFDDVRVRQAMRLIVDRQSMIDQILSGYGFDRQRPLRTLRRRLRQRPAAARAGHRPGQVAAEGGGRRGPHGRPAHHQRRGQHGPVATVFATQAKEAGVTVNVKNDPNYYGDDYLKLAFSVDFWGTRGYLNQVQQGSLPNSPYNETHWPPKSGDGSNFEDLYKQALAATDEGKRIDISTRCRRSSTTSAATSSRSSTT